MSEAVAHRFATYADLEAVPPYLVAEIIHGVLHTHPRPSPRHGKAALRLAYELAGPYDFGRDGPGGWLLLPEPELHLGRNVLVPDIAGWRRERLLTEPDGAHIDIAPDWVCEILSPSTEARDRGPKQRICGECGVRYLWMIDLRIRTLDAFERVAGGWLLVATVQNADPVRVPPFDVISFSLGLLWPYDPPAAPEPEQKS